MEDNGSSKDNISGASSFPNSGTGSGTTGSGGGGLGKTPSSSKAGDTSMYTALGTFNAEQRQKELQILAEEDFVGHLTKVKKDLQDQNEALRKKIADLKLKQKVLEAENKTTKSKKEAIQKEVQENKAKLAEVKERLVRKEMLIQKLKTARSDKQKQFEILMQKRQAYYDGVFEESPKGKLHRQVRQEVAKSQEILQSRQMSHAKLESKLKLKIKEQKERWTEFTEKCVKVAEYFAKKNQKEKPSISKPTWKSSSTLLVTDRYTCTWNELYEMSTPGKRLGYTQFSSTMASGEHKNRQRSTNESLLELKTKLDSMSSLKLSGSHRLSDMPPPPPPSRMKEFKPAEWTPSRARNTQSNASTNRNTENQPQAAQPTENSPATPALTKATTTESSHTVEQSSTQTPDQPNAVAVADPVPTIVVTSPDESSNTPIPMEIESSTTHAHEIQDQAQPSAEVLAAREETLAQLPGPATTPVLASVPSDTMYLKVPITDTSVHTHAFAPPMLETDISSNSNVMLSGINAIFTQAGTGNQQQHMFEAFSDAMENPGKEKQRGNHHFDSIFGTPPDGETTSGLDNDGFAKPFPVHPPPGASSPGQEPGSGRNNYLDNIFGSSTTSSGNIWGNPNKIGDFFTF